MDIASATAGTASSSTSTGARAELFDNYEAFLGLLSTQLQHQDPLDPLDATEYTSQLVQYANVEQQLRANNYLEQLIGLTATNAITGALGYIGRQIEAQGGTAHFDGESAAWSYTLGDNASSVSLTITDSDGKVVRKLDGETLAGRHELTWDGKNSEGDTVAPGGYTLSVDAVDGNDAAIGTATTAFGTVTGVDSASGTLLLTVGELGIALGNIVSVDALPD